MVEAPQKSHQPYGARQKKNGRRTKSETANPYCRSGHHEYNPAISTCADTRKAEKLHSAGKLQDRYASLPVPPMADSSLIAGRWPPRASCHHILFERCPHHRNECLHRIVFLRFPGRRHGRARPNMAKRWPLRGVPDFIPELEPIPDHRMGDSLAALFAEGFSRWPDFERS